MLNDPIKGFKFPTKRDLPTSVMLYDTSNKSTAFKKPNAKMKVYTDSLIELNHQLVNYQQATQAYCYS